MNEGVKELLAVRTVAIRLPNGETEYWLTDRIFSAGQAVRCRDQEWVVGGVFDAFERSGHPTVTLRKPESVSPDMA